MRRCAFHRRTPASRSACAPACAARSLDAIVTTPYAIRDAVLPDCGDGASAPSIFKRTTLKYSLRAHVNRCIVNQRSRGGIHS